MPTLSTTLGAEDRFWDDGIALIHTPRWMSSGSSGDVNQVPILEAHGTMAQADALRTDDTATYAQVDEAGFKAATEAATGFPGGFFIYVKASSDLPLSIPPAAEVTSLSFSFTVVARNVSGTGDLHVTANTGVFSQPPASRHGGQAVTAILGGWNRYVLPVMAPINPALTPDRYEAVRQHLAARLLSAYVWTEAPTTLQVAYIECNVTYEPVTPFQTPFRRTFPRDDTRRTWPRPKSIQGSNRTSGGYL